MRYGSTTFVDVDEYVSVNVENLTKYSREEVIFELSILKGRQIPNSTFYRWLGDASITPKEEYNEAELNKLKKVCTHYKRNRSRKTLKL